ncbi:hypothetical protein ABEB36_005654 [Hypothenemus hampei]|uniref:Uncharacterized protein n=1 Tax=Hypothenemus hampei TaxID=57062 RepID=A0ABD1EZ04_HYPHA
MLLKVLITILFLDLTLAERLESSSNYPTPSSFGTLGTSGRFSTNQQFGGSNFPSSSFGQFRSQSSSIGAPSSFDRFSNTNSFGSSQFNSFDRRNAYSSGSRFQGGPQIRILRLDNENSGTGNYRFEYETENQIKQQEVGEQKILGDEQVASVHGTYSYISPDGQHLTVNYIADENGFRAQGNHLPTQPGLPSDSQGYGQSSGYNSAFGGYQGPQSVGGYQSSGGYSGNIQNFRGFQGNGFNTGRNRQDLNSATSSSGQGNYNY